MPHRIRRQGDRIGRLHGILAAGGQDKREKERAFHGLTLRKARTASDIAATGQSRTGRTDCQTGMTEAAPPTPADTPLAPEAARLNRRNASAGLTRSATGKASVVNQPPLSATTAARSARS